MKFLPLPRDLDKELFEGVFGQLPEASRDAKLVMPSGFAYSSTESHVLLAACQPRQKAREGTFGGFQRGRFTHHLLDCLRRTPSLQITYAALMDTVSQQLTRTVDTEFSGGTANTDIPDQQPHCEGSHKWRLLFSTKEEKSSESFDLAMSLYRNIGPDRVMRIYTLLQAPCGEAVWTLGSYTTIVGRMEMV